MPSTEGPDARPWLSELAATMVVLIAAGASVAAAVWFARYDELTSLVRENAMSSPARTELLTVALGCGLACCAVGLGYSLWHRTAAAVHRVHRVACILMPLTVCFAVPLLLDGYAYRDKALLFCIATVGFGLCLERSLRISFDAIGRQGWEQPSRVLADLRIGFPRAWRWVPPIVVGAMALGLAVYMSIYGVMHHYRLQTRALDMAVFDNLMWNLLRGEWYQISPGLGVGSHIQTHASFGAILIAPLYGLRQHADSLIVIQATLCALAVVPIYLLARRRLGTAWLALAFAYGYVVYAPVHGPLFYDFHFLTLAPFFVGWVLYLFESGRRGWLVVAWVVAISMREELSAGLAMACLFYLLSGKRPVWALAGGLLSASYFLLAKFVVMPAFRTRGMPVASFDWLYGELRPERERGFDAILRTIGSNPLFTFNSMLTKDKATYLLQLLGPVLLLPLRHGRAWLLLVAPAVFTVLATAVPALHSTRFQYAAHWAAYVFVAAAITLSAWRGLPDGRVRIAAAGLALVVVSTVFSHQYGAIFHRRTFKGGFVHVQFHLTERDRQRHADLYDLIGLIGPGASVAATETEAPHVSARRDFRTLRYDHGNADYLLVNVREARKRKETNDNLRSALDTGRYGFLGSSGDFALWGKGKDPSRNDEGDELIGRAKDASRRPRAR